MNNVYVNSVDITDYIFMYEEYEEMDKEHIIGNAISKQIKLTLKNKDDHINFDHPFIIDGKTYIVYEKPEKWTKSISLTLYDMMIDTNIVYDTKLEYPTTINSQLNEMEELIDISIDKSTLSDDVLNKEVSWYDSTMMIRNYIGFIAECDGKNAYIENDTIVFKKLALNSYNTNYCSNYELNELITYTRVCYDDGISKYDKGDDSKHTLYISPNNSYINQDDIDRIYDMYNGLSFFSFKKFNCKEIDNIHITDLISYHDFIVMPISIKRKVYGGESKNALEMSCDIVIKNAESVIIKNDQTLRIKRLQTIVNQNESSLKILSQNVETKFLETGNQIDSLNTSLTLEQGKIETLIQDNKTIINGNEVTLKEAYSYIKQEVDAINFAISETGGNNKLLNSTGWNGIKYWDSDGDVVSETNNDIRSNTISGYSFLINNGHIEQSFKTIVGRKYSVSCKIKKFTNSCTFIIKNGTSNDVLFNLNEEYVDGWVVFSMPIEAADTHCSVYIESNGEYLYVSDIMVNDGEIVQQWSSSNDEVYTTNVKIDGTGVEVSQVDTNNRTVMNTNEFAGYDGEKKVFALNGDTTEVNKLKAASDVQIGVVKAYSLTKGTKIGLGFAFIKGGDA